MIAKTILWVLILSFSQTGWAKCPEDVQVINKGQVANCDGLLFSPEASKKVDETQQDAEYYKSLSAKLQIRHDYMLKEQEILDKRLKLYVDQSNTLAKEVIDKDNSDKWQKLGYFALGVLATGAAVYGAAQINNR
jgi:hypothetical protein